MANKEPKTLADAFHTELRDVYDSERQLVKAIPTMVTAATNPDLRAALDRHLVVTEGHVARLEEIFALLEEKPRGKHCAGMAGILEEGKEIVEDEGFDEAARDACLIAACQRAEHYEISAYGTLVAWANTLGHRSAVGLLEQTLEEEKDADLTLSRLAEGDVNVDAATA